MIRILFVCHANICRSPMAEAIMSHLINEAGLTDRILVDSAGTHCERVGQPAYELVSDVLHEHGIETRSVSRQLQYDDLTTFDYVLAMDRRNLSFMLRHSTGSKAEVRLFLQDAQMLGIVSRDEVRDPYPDGDFDEAYSVIRAGCTALLSRLRSRHQI